MSGQSGSLAVLLFLALCGGIYCKSTSKRLTKLDREEVRYCRLSGDGAEMRIGREDKFGRGKSELNIDLLDYRCRPLEPFMFETGCLVECQPLTSRWHDLEYRNICIVFYERDGWNTSILALDSSHASRKVALRFPTYYGTIRVIAKSGRNASLYGGSIIDSVHFLHYEFPAPELLSNITVTPSPSPSAITQPVAPDHHDGSAPYITLAVFGIGFLVILGMGVFSLVAALGVIYKTCCTPKRKYEKRHLQEEVAATGDPSHFSSSNIVEDFSDENVSISFCDHDDELFPPSASITRSTRASTSNSSPSSSGYSAGDEISRIVLPARNRGSANCPRLPACATTSPCLHSSTDELSSLSMSTLGSRLNCHLSPHSSTSSSRNTLPIIHDRSSAEGESYQDDIPNLSYQSNTGSAVSFPSTVSVVSPEEEEGQVCPQVVVDHQESALDSRSTARPTVGGFTGSETTSSCDSIPAPEHINSEQDLPPLMYSSVDEETEC